MNIQKLIERLGESQREVRSLVDTLAYVQHQNSPNVVVIVGGSNISLPKAALGNFIGDKLTAANAEQADLQSKLASVNTHLRNL